MAFSKHLKASLFWCSVALGIALLAPEYYKSSHLFPTSQPFVCKHEYNIEIVSLDPLALYINNFISEAEIDHLFEITEGKYVYSESRDPNRVYAPRRRTSSSVILSSEDPVVQCIDKRANGFAGFLDHESFESLQLVKYLDTERHDFHYDWFEYPPRLQNGEVTCNRASSFFVYLGGNATGGETYFPELLSVPADGDGSKFVRTNSEDGLVVFHPIAGNAIFWVNLHENGTGDDRNMHAGLPVIEGEKIGLNIWPPMYY
ncbi:hypothetical protein BDV96DRAFT_554518 [Lophiotrema nucula]|uniref:Prolyl 4-hydroxylase alpha subunit domain-containing protein n=1 Tax=Lophiotrema nucula TaxID=690887 RepID=A0A6A5YRM4_9PLEO|nr:hypothetical protein BDV96DRAFT_554518 [Lophiotrema nucula]